jgi:hypothetical protein
MVIYNNGLWSIVQTGSLRVQGRRALGPRFVRFAALFYGALAVIAALWCGLRGFEVRILGESPAASVLLGVLTAACTVSLGLLASRSARDLRRARPAPGRWRRFDEPRARLGLLRSG